MGEPNSDKIICTTCRVLKPRDEYYPRGYRCKDCRRAYSNRYYYAVTKPLAAIFPPLDKPTRKPCTLLLYMKHPWSVRRPEPKPPKPPKPAKVTRAAKASRECGVPTHEWLMENSKRYRKTIGKDARCSLLSASRLTR